jgi:hypothetical protein
LEAGFCHRASRVQVYSATTKWSAQLDDGIAHTFVSTAVSSRLRCRMLDMGCGRYQGPIVLVPSPVA